jgi:hypothetical protein
MFQATEASSSLGLRFVSDQANKKTGGTMTCRIKPLLFILLFALGIFHSHAAQAQSSCTPTLYLFRHGEDRPKGQPNGLTPVGLTHAALYPDMTSQLTNLQNLCPVKRVFAMWNRDIGQGIIKGTVNPYQTALPLAQYVGMQAIPPVAYVPEMFFTDTDGHKYYLCEYPSDPTNCEADAGIKKDGTSPHRNVLTRYSGDTYSHFYSYLSAYFATNPNVSVAIFHTSDGMASVSTALGVNPVVATCRDPSPCTDLLLPTRACPLPVDAATSASSCYTSSNFNKALSWPGIQRSSVDIFSTQDNPQNRFVKNYSRISPKLDQTHNLRQTLGYYQCYNFDPGAETLSSVYYCTYSGNLGNGIPIKDTDTTLGKNGVKLSDIRAKVCYSPNIEGNPAFVSDSFGHCNEHPAGPRVFAPHDLDANTISDIVWRDTSGNVGLWLMNGTGVASSGGLGNVPMTWSIVGQRDFNGDGNADLLWHDTSGNVAIWEMNGTTILNSSGTFVANVPTTWSIVGLGDFNADGMGDLLWQDASGNVAIWEMNGTTILNQNSPFVATVPGQWSIRGTGDFNGDGMTDILWQDASGNVAIWEMNGTAILNASSSFVANVPSQWSIRGTGDFNGDGSSDILWQDTSGNVAIWEMNGTTILNPSSSFVGTVPGPWSIAETGDFDGDGKSDLLWRDASGNTAMWLMNGTAVASTVSLANVPTSWTVQAVNVE